MADRTWICSADSHLVEPANLWVERLPASLRERAPRIEYQDRHRIYHVGGKPRIKVPEPFNSLSDGTRIPSDVDTRLALLDVDGVWAELITGSIGMLAALSARDAEIAAASAAVYNDWTIERYKDYRDRQIVPSIIQIVDVDLAVREIGRVAKMGTPGILMPIRPPEPYYLSKWEPIWAAAAAHSLPIGFRAGTGHGFHAICGMNAAAARSANEKDGAKSTRVGNLAKDAFATVAALIGAGVLERYPQLHVVFIETGAGWMATALQALDFTWIHHPGQDERGIDSVVLIDDSGRETVVTPDEVFGGTWRYPLKPSEYARRQVHATFQNEPGAIKFRHDIGIECLLWGSGFPNVEGTWPHTQRVVSELFVGVGAKDKEAILGGTMRKLFGVKAPKATPAYA